MIHQMKDLITRAGKKAYTFVMGRPNPAKLANFPEVNHQICMMFRGVLFICGFTEVLLYFCSVMSSFMFLVHKLLYWIAKSS